MPAPASRRRASTITVLKPNTTPTLAELLRDAGSNPEALRRLTSMVSTAQRDLRHAQTFNIAFRRHAPEFLRYPANGLTTPAVQVGTVVASLDRDDDRAWEVVSIAGNVAHLREYPGLAYAGEVEWLAAATAALTDLVPVAVEKMAAGLSPICPSVRTGAPAQPDHVAIKGDNLHALEMLQETHREAVDLIYIDPPYNTLNGKWIYNDRKVAETDGHKHNKWLTFMERRLRLAHGLLKRTGIFIAAIDNAEHARLKLLLDSVFGEQNFIASVTWQGGMKNNDQFTGGGLDYMLIYARDVSAVTRKWRTPKEGLDDLLAAGAAAWEESGHDAERATRLLSGWWSRNKKAYDPGLGDNVKVGADGELFKVGNLSAPGGGGARYAVLNPLTGTAVRVPSRGWAWSEETMIANIAAGRVHFSANPAASLRSRTPLTEMSRQVPAPSFYSDRRGATKHLEKVLGDKRFPYPKDHAVLMKWIAMAAPEDAVILDFFGGSGTTVEAVMRLNAVDGGSRQCILVTNNEVSEADEKKLRAQGRQPGDPEWEARGVFEHVTRPRLETLATGVRPDGTTYDGATAANISFFALTYRSQVPKGRAWFPQRAPVLWLRAGARGEWIKGVSRKGYAISRSGDYAFLFNTDRLGDLVEALDGARVRRVFVSVAQEADWDREHVTAALRELGVADVVEADDFAEATQVNRGYQAIESGDAA